MLYTQDCDIYKNTVERGEFNRQTTQLMYVSSVKVNISRRNLSVSSLNGHYQDVQRYRVYAKRGVIFQPNDVLMIGGWYYVVESATMHYRNHSETDIVLKKDV
jgi:hypothetical protein